MKPLHDTPDSSTIPTESDDATPTAPDAPRSSAEMLERLPEWVRAVAAGVQYLPDPAMLGDADDRLVYVNEAFSRAYGWRPEEAWHRTPKELFKSYVHDANFYKNAEHQLDSGHVWRSVITSRRKDGSLADFDAVVTPLLDSDGRRAYSFAVNRDLSDRRLLHARLAEAEHLATVGNLAAGIAHEVNNPLAAAQSNVEWMRELLSRQGHSEAVSVADETNHALRRIARVVQDLRTFASSEKQTEPGRATQATEPLSVSSLIDRAIAITSYETRHRTRVFNQCRSPHLVTGSEALIQVFVNLIVGTCQRLPAGQADRHSIHIRSEQGETHISIEMTDNGPSLSPQALRHMFDPYFATSASDVYRIGITLSASKHAVESHGGSLELRGGDVGTTAVVTLPRAAAASVTHLGTATRPTIARLRILLVDDEAIVRRAMCRVLSDHDVVPIGSGRDALAVLATDRDFDVILCDLMMPEVSGMMVFDDLGWIAPELRERTLFLTGGAVSEDAQRFVSEHTERVLHKPIDRMQLLDRLQELGTHRR